MADKKPEFLIKYQIEKIFHNWLLGISDYELFENPIVNEKDIFIELTNKNKKIHKNQLVFKS